ncbi:uncharacterized protein EI97DRAFT_430833 [Westerdykella ornata]|uniref:Protein kinase domain-containing protein n=1 Tax=Westerdykella ornata TaxID=318751 RepID=A0A6A6JUQ1_WESOR|nr:uncharacterized protein EI97DRAFT_430833 [Westerdykella ornata]KAF2279823.1 hypothetical protein EI97DRAFT_430833 [Westerdykella ornata]
MDTITGFPRRLTQLYTDTKASCDAVVEQDSPETQPELNALHRKYRIQKDRLIAWGLQWSDSAKGKQDDIAESVERAGLTETVTSVLGTIKDILDEAERMLPTGMQAHVKAGIDEKGGVGSRPSDGAAWAASDRSRYEDLARDLTTSIDILYDLSRSRRTGWDDALATDSPSKAEPVPPRPASSTAVFLSSEYNASDLTLINPATQPAFPTVAEASPVQNTPPRLSLSDLILPEEEPPPYESVGVSSSTRVIGKLRSQRSFTNPWKADGNRPTEIPVLVEYAAFDPVYRETQVPPPIDRLEKLLSILTRLSEEKTYHGTLKCLGYFEDLSQARFGLVFELPAFVYSGADDASKPLEDLRPVTLLSVLQTGSKSEHTSTSVTPPLEDRFRLAFTLCLAFNKLHLDNFAHKDVNSSNILVFRKSRCHSANSKALQYALRSPVVCAFDLFSDSHITASDSTQPQPLNIYRHPQDPMFTGERDRQHGPHFDLYSLGLILLEIGLWIPLSDLWKPKYTLADFKQRVEEVYTRRLASKCGTAYMQAVRDCFWTADQIASGAEDPEHFSQLYNRIRIRLQRCCLLDEAEPCYDFDGSRSQDTLPSSSPLKRKGITAPEADLPPSPSHRSAKRWAFEKGSEVLERTRTLSKTSPRSSPNLASMSRHGSIRRSISHFISPREEEVLSPPAAQDRSDVSAGNKESRTSHAESTDSFRGPMSFRDYREKITIIQKAWRRRRAKRASTIQTLLAVSTPPAVVACPPERVTSYPTPEPEVETENHTTQQRNYLTSIISIQREMDPVARPKLRLQPVKFSPAMVDEWHTTMLPRLERLLERALKDSDETISIDLVAIGETAASARPTIFVTCSSTAKVKALLSRRFRYDESVYDLRVRRGKVRRSKVNRSTRRRNPPHRSMMNTDTYGADMPVMNPWHQQRPLCGASIGAFRGVHLPPVSYGGVVLVDDEPMGMSVHHLLDAPSEDESEAGDGFGGPRQGDAVPSSARRDMDSMLAGMGSQPGLQMETDLPPSMWELELSDDELDKSDEEDDASFDFSDSQFASDDEFDDDDDLADSITSAGTTGDIAGIPLGEGDEIKITQPAIDDVDDDFFPNEEDRDDDHLCSHELGYVHASSGIRRWNRDGIVHEIDWALLKLNEDRLQPYNLLQGGRRFCFDSTLEPDQREISLKLEQPVCRRHYRPEEDEYPNGIASADKLGGMNVHCFGRTSGLQAGMVGAAMSSVRIYRRKTFSRSWHVEGDFGMGGDSGAWVVQNGTHRVVGHVLAWCERNRIAYICPMEVLFEDMRRTLGAKRIYLPGSAEEAQHAARVRGGRRCVEDADGGMGQLEAAVEGLGIVDSAVDMRDALQGKRGRVELPLLNTGGESDKENVPVMRSRVIKVREGRGGQLGVA